MGESTRAIAKRRRAVLAAGISCFSLILLALTLPLAARGGSAPPPPHAPSSSTPSTVLAGTQIAHLIAPDGVWGSYFGYSVAVDGGTAIVGARDDTVGGNFKQGSAYVFVRSGDVWTQQAKLTAADGVALDSLGWSVAISGDTVAVGSCPETGAGSVYVFSRSGDNWSQQAKVTDPLGVVGSQFGASVAILDDTLVVGAQGDTVATSKYQGSAYVFTRTGDVWSQQARLIASDGASPWSFGSSVGITPETVLVGAPGATVQGRTGQGAAYIFTRSGTTWSQQAVLTADDGMSGDGLGRSVALTDGVAVAGATSALGGKGAAYTFTRSGVTWTQQAELKATDGSEGDDFGCALAIDGDTVVVGARTHRVRTASAQGAAYLFSRIGSGWIQQSQMTADDESALDGFSSSVALSGSTAMVGSYFDTVGEVDRRGSAYMFSLARVALPTIASISPPHARPVATVVVNGGGFGAAQGIYSVTFGGVEAAVVDWSDDAIVCTVPVDLAPKVVRVSVHAVADSAAVLFVVDDPVRPSISALSSTSGRPGSTLIVTGRHFGASPSTSIVSFGARTATRFLSWSATKIKMRVPKVAKGRCAVRVVTPSGKSKAKYFTVR